MSAKSPQQYRPSRRSWIKLWVSEWLDGTVRWQLNSQQRAIWADLLALAGYSRFPGIVTPGRDGKEFCAYPVAHLANIFGCSQETVRETLQLLEQQGRIANKEGVVHILNWEKYQSEYQQKRQRRRYTETTRSDSDYVPRKSSKCPPKTPTEEVEVEEDKKREEKKEAPMAPGIVPVALWLAFVEMRKKNRKGMTDTAGELIRRELEKLKEQGHDPIAVLEQSIRNGWQDVFPVREERNGARQSNPSREQQRHERTQQAIKNVTGSRSGLAERLRDGVPGGVPGGTHPRLPRSTEGVEAGPTAPGVPPRDEKK